MSGVRGVQRVLMMIAVPRKCKMTEVRGKSFKEGYIRGERSFQEGYQVGRISRKDIRGERI
jgi:hypothetical protein